MPEGGVVSDQSDALGDLGEVERERKGEKEARGNDDNPSKESREKFLESEGGRSEEGDGDGEKGGEEIDGEVPGVGHVDNGEDKSEEEVEWGQEFFILGEKILPEEREKEDDNREVDEVGVEIRDNEGVDGKFVDGFIVNVGVITNEAGGVWIPVVVETIF